MTLSGTVSLLSLLHKYIFCSIFLIYTIHLQQFVTQIQLLQYIFNLYHSFTTSLSHQTTELLKHSLHLYHSSDVYLHSQHADNRATRGTIVHMITFEINPRIPNRELLQSTITLLDNFGKRQNFFRFDKHWPT